MIEIGEGAVTNWVNTSGYGRPQAIRTHCGYCGDKVIFSPKSINDLGYGEQMDFLLRCSCPSCSKTVTFFVVDSVKNGSSCASLAMHPAFEFRREAMRGVEKIPEGIRAEYEDVLKAFNAEVYRGVAGGIRVALEAIVAHKNPMFQGKRYEKLQQLIGKESTPEIIQALAFALKEGGDAGSHFDRLVRPDRDLAANMVTFLEFYLEYSFILPDAVDQLVDRLTGGESQQ